MNLGRLRRGDSLLGKKAFELGTFHNKELFDDSYVLLEEINCGGFGTVYCTHHISDPHEKFAVKVIDIDSDSHHRTKEAIIHEAKVMCLLREVPNIIQLHDYFMDADAVYIVQDLALGGDVFDRLAERETYTEKDARELCKLLLTTMGHVHSNGIVHRDLKPENLLLKSMDCNSEILLCDFGNAAELSSLSNNHNHNNEEEEGFTTMVGTAAYMAPEIVRGDAYREKVDLWAVGCILFILLCGELPFGDSDDDDVYDRIQACNAAKFEDDFEESNWDVISGSAKKLIIGLLRTNPQKRLNVHEALASRWFQKKDSYLKTIKLQRSLDGIKDIVHRKKTSASRIHTKKKSLAKPHHTD